jgi:hypothetical protein
MLFPDVEVDVLCKAAKLFRSMRPELVVDIGQIYECTLVDEGACDGLPNASGRTSNERNFSFKSLHCHASLLDAERLSSAAVLALRSGGKTVGWSALCTPDMGMN